MALVYFGIYNVVMLNTGDGPTTVLIHTAPVSRPRPRLFQDIYFQHAQHKLLPKICPRDKNNYINKKQFIN